MHKPGFSGRSPIGSRSSDSPRRCNRRTSQKIAAAAFSLLSGLAGRSSLAGPDTWLGLSPTWENGSNWSSGAVPTFAQTPIVFSTYVNTIAQPTLTANETIGALQFQSGGWQIGGSQTLEVSAIDTSGTSASNVIQDNLSFVSASGLFAFASPGESLTLNGNISSSSSATITGSSPTLVLNGANSNWTGGLSISATSATITAGSATALGSGPITVGSSTVSFSNTSGSVVSAGGLILSAGSANLSIASTGTAGFSFGSVAFSSSGGSLSVTGTSGLNFSITGTTTLGNFGTFTSSTATCR